MKPIAVEYFVKKNIQKKDAFIYLTKLLNRKITIGKEFKRDYLVIVVYKDTKDYITNNPKDSVKINNWLKSNK